MIAHAPHTIHQTTRHAAARATAPSIAMQLRLREVSRATARRRAARRLHAETVLALTFGGVLMSAMVILGV